MPLLRAGFRIFTHTNNGTAVRPFRFTSTRQLATITVSADGRDLNKHGIDNFYAPSRYCWAAQRWKIYFVQCPDGAGGGAGRQLPVRDDRTERRRRSGTGRTAACAGEDEQGTKDSARDGRVRRHCRIGTGSVEGRGVGKSVSCEHPRDRRG